jgi:hypothetical protein
MWRNKHKCIENPFEMYVIPVMDPKENNLICYEISSVLLPLYVQYPWLFK